MSIYLLVLFPFMCLTDQLDSFDRELSLCLVSFIVFFHFLSLSGGPPDVGKMLGGEEKEEDPDAAKKEEERQEALRQQEEERKAKYAKMEAERESMRQGIRDKVWRYAV